MVWDKKFSGKIAAGCGLLGETGAESESELGSTWFYPVSGCEEGSNMFQSRVLHSMKNNGCKVAIYAIR